MATFSLVIATVGRKHQLERLLNSLAVQNKRPHQIILVDQNPRGYLDDIIRPFTKILPLTLIRTVPEGVSAARNLGLAHVTGDIVAFPDDDCWYFAHTLERVDTFFSSSPELGGVVVSWAEKLLQPGFEINLKPVTPVNAFWRAGTLVQFYRKEVIDGVAYDLLLGPGTGLPYGCGEDTDFLLQVMGKGHVVKRTAEVLIGHPELNIYDNDRVSKIHAYARGRMYLLHKHNFSLWFKFVNILYPLARLLHEGPQAWQYRKTMFWGRLKAFFQN